MEILIIWHLRIVSRLGVLHFYQKVALPMKLADLSDTLKKAFKSVCILTAEPYDPERADSCRYPNGILL
jgi:hypothetical protein